MVRDTDIEQLHEELASLRGLVECLRHALVTITVYIQDYVYDARDDDLRIAHHDLRRAEEALLVVTNQLRYENIDAYDDVFYGQDEEVMSPDERLLDRHKLSLLSREIRQWQASD